MGNSCSRFRPLLQFLPFLESFLATKAAAHSGWRVYVNCAKVCTRSRTRAHGGMPQITACLSIANVFLAMLYTQKLPISFGAYRLIKKLGAGGMGVVYLAEDAVRSCEVALKMPNSDLLDNDRALLRFQEEARIAQKIKHPCICPVYDFGQIDGIFYLTMPYIEGTALSRLIGPDRQWQPTRAAQIVQKIALAVNALHQQRIIHRDLKPHNIIVQSDDLPILMDFGLARTLSESYQQLTRSGDMLGTPAYMPPELWAVDSQNITPATDTYSLGVILYELLTGRPPYKGSVAEIYSQLTSGALSKPSLRCANVPADLDSICLRALATDFKERYQSAADFQTALVSFLERHADVVRTPTSDATAEGTYPSTVAVTPIEFMDTPSARKESPIRTNSLGMGFVLVPSGLSYLGGGGGRVGSYVFSTTKELYCGVFPVTQAEWQKVMEGDPSFFKGNPDYPVENVSFTDIEAYISKLNQLLTSEGLTYRLPTALEWEFICRGGPISSAQSQFHFYFVDSKTSLRSIPSNDLSSEHANFDGRYPYGSASVGQNRQRPCDVGSYLPNSLGIYDMHGNVWERTTTEEGSGHALKGGSWLHFGSHCRASESDWVSAQERSSCIGFRLVAEQRIT